MGNCSGKSKTPDCILECGHKSAKNGNGTCSQCAAHPVKQPETKAAPAPTAAPAADSTKKATTTTTALLVQTDYAEGAYKQQNPALVETAPPTPEAAPLTAAALAPAALAPSFILASSTPLPITPIPGGTPPIPVQASGEKSAYQLPPDYTTAVPAQQTERKQVHFEPSQEPATDSVLTTNLQSQTMEQPTQQTTTSTPVQQQPGQQPMQQQPMQQQQMQQQPMQQQQMPQQQYQQQPMQQQQYQQQPMQYQQQPMQYQQPMQQQYQQPMQYPPQQPVYQSLPPGGSSNMQCPQCTVIVAMMAGQNVATCPMCHLTFTRPGTQVQQVIIKQEVSAPPEREQPQMQQAPPPQQVVVQQSPGMSTGGKVALGVAGGMILGRAMRPNVAVVGRRRRF